MSSLAKIYRRNFKWLIVVHAAIKNGSVTRAAEELCIGQPGVTKIIAKVVGGASLFDRHCHGLNPSKKAVALIPAIERLIILSDKVFTAIESDEEDVSLLDVYTEDAVRIQVLEAENAMLKGKIEAARDALGQS